MQLLCQMWQQSVDSRQLSVVSCQQESGQLSVIYAILFHCPLRTGHLRSRLLFCSLHFKLYQIATILLQNAAQYFSQLLQNKSDHFSQQTLKISWPKSLNTW
jgi:hypothetical protein